MRIEREDLLRFDSSLGRMWLETDGEGGFASSTILLCATSRYHGLLVAPPPGSSVRHVFVSRFEETLVAAGREFPLSMARYGGGAFHPAGHQYVSRFEPAPFPRWSYGIGEIEAVREILMVRGSPAVLVRWRVHGAPGGVTLRIRPFIPCREADALTFENPALNSATHAIASGLVVRPYESLPAVALTTSARATFVAEPQWNRGVEFSDDLARGYGGHEDQFSPGWFDVPLAPGDDLVVAATIGGAVADPKSAWETESRRRRKHTPVTTGLRAALERAAGQFIVTIRPAAAAPAAVKTRSKGALAPSRSGVIAGFPWFGAWGRDTCIALPGLLLPRGLVEECGTSLVALATYLRRGRLPNRFGVNIETSEYSAADPALWFARAVRLWELAGGGEERLLEELYPALALIVAGYCEPHDDVSMDDAALISARTGKSAATWMDAVPEGVPVTPRDGCAVEVNALWYFLLDYAARLARRRGMPEERRGFEELKRRAGVSFLARFWLDDERRLADRWAAGAADRSVRPNMVIAAALEFSPLSDSQRAAVVEVARTELLTPRGLRTLSPRDPRYRGRYEGGVASRDAAYHQGTVWPWLFGFYAEAAIRANGRGKGVKSHLLGVLTGFAPHLEEGMLGQVAEVFDGDAPHRPGGAWAQAWSVAELLRAFALVEPSPQEAARGSTGGGPS